MKRNGCFVIAIAAAIMLCINTLGLGCFSYGAEQAGVKYVWKDNDPSTKIRTGIESIDFDDVTYYDMEQGKGDTKATSDNVIEFYKKALTGNAASGEADSKYPGNTSELNLWAELAEKIFTKNSTYSYERYNDDYDYTKNWGRAGYTDLSEALSSTSDYSAGDSGDDCTRITGLKYAKSLQAVRKECSRSIYNAIDTYSLRNRYDYNNLEGDNILNAGGDEGADNNLKALKDDKNQDVLYTIATCVDCEGSTFGYRYSSFVLAFYDFKLVPITADGVQCISAAEGYNSIQEAKNKGVSGVDYSSDEENSSNVGTYKNESIVPNTASMTFNETSSESVNNSFTSGKSYSFSECIENTFSWGRNDQFFHDSLKIGFTTSQVINESTTKGEGKSKSETNAVTTSLTLPAQTGVSLDTTAGTTSQSLKYDCPVAITYKVAIASMAGKLYADRGCCCYFDTAEYPHESMNVTFGTDDVKGGLTARENLYKRTISNISTSGFEENYGNVSGWNHKISHQTKRINTLDWNNLLEDKVDPSKGTKVYADIEYDEVDKEGKMTGRVIGGYQYGQQLSAGYDYEIAPADKGEYEYQVEDYDYDEYTDPEKVPKTDCIATLYHGKVYNEEGKEIDNTISDKDTKTLTATVDGSNKLVFYYQNPSPVPGKETTVADGDEEGDDQVDEDSSQITSVNTAVSRRNTPLTKEQILSVAKWLGDHNVMASTGGTIIQNKTVENTVIGEVVPLYDLKYILITNGLTTNDIIAKESGSTTEIGELINAKDLSEGIDLTAGEEFYTRGLNLAGYNANLVSYQGFCVPMGTWKRVVKNDQGKWIEDLNEHNDKIASFGKNEAGIECVTAGDIENLDDEDITLEPDENGEYTVYFQYFINDNTYKSMESSDYVTNDQVARDVLKVNVKKTPFNGSLSLDGEVKAVVGSESDLNEELNARVMDDTGKEIAAPVTWEAKELKGISVSEDGLAEFTKPGTYHVRFSSNSINSNWVEITAQSAAELDSIEFQAPEFKTKAVTLTDDVDSLSFDLSSFLTYKDQYGENWTGDKPEVNFDLDQDYTAASIDDQGMLTVTEAGTYKVYAESEGYDIAPITITIKDNRTHAVVLEQDELTNAEAFLDSQVVANHGSVSLTVKPEEGYQFATAPEISIKEGSAKISSPVANEDGTYSCQISDVTSGVTIAASGKTVLSVANITAKGDVQVVIGGHAKNLYDEVTVTIEDKTGKNITTPYTWQVKEVSGVSVNEKGTIIPKKTGDYHIRAVTESGAMSKWVNLEVIKINVNKTKIKKISRGKKKLIVQWSANKKKIQGKHVTGYKIMYSRTPSMKNYKIKTVKGYSKHYKGLYSLAKKKYYYVKMRSYFVYDGDTYYSGWSSVKKIKTK